MKTTLKQITSISVIVILLSLTVVAVIDAAVSLNPLSAPDTSEGGGTMKTLTDIYNRITTGADAELHNLNPLAGPAGTMWTLDDIYNAVPANDKILYGTYAGTANTPPDSGDVATADQILTGYYAFNTDGIALVGTASAGSSILEWSTDQGSMGWDAAMALCPTLGIGARLPTFIELEEAMTEQFINLNPFMSEFEESWHYWSSDEVDSDYAFTCVGAWNDGFVSEGESIKGDINLVRCVR